tara:strand:+ start:25 stop:393 length:369 start_codon:yes stop_codon:yes gene_type:complete
MTTTMNIIKITGKTWLGVESAEEYMKDMLRYDDATIFSLKQEKGNREFEAIVVGSRYTPARWLSFGLCPTLVDGTKDAWKTQMSMTQVISREDMHIGIGKEVISLKDIQQWIDNSENVKVIN